MKSMGRMARKGFTLVELMVVILIIALLASIIAVNVIGAVDENKVNLDAEALSKFAADLTLGVSRESRIVRALPDDTDSAQAMFLQLFRKGVLKQDAIKRLAGASGAGGTDTDYDALKNGTETLFPDDKMCIFTAPKTVKELNANLQANRDEGGPYILMVYNETILKDKLDIGIALLNAGSTTARVVKKEAFDLEYGVALADNPYGSKPFQIVSPR